MTDAPRWPPRSLAPGSVDIDDVLGLADALAAKADEHAGTANTIWSPTRPDDVPLWTVWRQVDGDGWETGVSEQFVPPTE